MSVLVCFVWCECLILCASFVCFLLVCFVCWVIGCFLVFFGFFVVLVFNEMISLGCVGSWLLFLCLVVLLVMLCWVPALVLFQCGLL